MRPNQTFVQAEELKLAKLDAHYSTLPDEMKRSGLHRFANNPPEDTFFLTRLWDKYQPGWREWKEKEKVRRESQPSNPREKLTIGEANDIHMESKAMSRKGKWQVFGQDVK